MNVATDTDTGTTVVYFHDGTLEGFFSAVFDAYTNPQKPDIITTPEGFQCCFDQVSVYIETENHKCERVYRGIHKHMGHDGYYKVKMVFLSPSPDKDTILYKYLQYGFKVGRKILNDLAHPDVTPVEHLLRETQMEAHRMRMFARFARLDNGVYFSRINPKCNVLPLVMDHFAQRFNVQPFIIYDEVHHLAGIYDMKRWYLQYVEQMDIPACATDDLRYQRLWKKFYDAVAIEERKNHNLRRNFMPLRFWRNLTEMTYIETAEKHMRNTFGRTAEQTPYKMEQIDSALAGNITLQQLREPAHPVSLSDLEN